MAKSVESANWWDEHAKYQRSVDADPLIFVSGDVAPEASGGGRGGLESQAQILIVRLSETLESHGAGLAQLAKLVVYYRQPDVDESALRACLGAALGGNCEVAVTFVPLASLRHAGALLELEAYAVRGGSRETVNVPGLARAGAGFCHGIKCGDFCFVSGQSALTAEGAVRFPCDLVSQNKACLDGLEAVLAELGMGPETIVKGNSWRADPPSVEAYTLAAKDRFRFFADARPSFTGITIPGLEPQGLFIRLDVWAMSGDIERQRLAPPNHWGWALKTTYSHGFRAGQWLFIGGQAALDPHCNVLSSDELLPQTGITMDYIESILTAAGGGPDDVVKLNELHVAAPHDTAALEVLGVHASRFGRESPAWSGVPVDHLAYQGQSIEIDAIARLSGRA